MNLSGCSISLTPKGVDEIKNRTNKVSVKYRSVLIHLGAQPQSVDSILQMPSVYKSEEVIEAITGLIQEQYVALHEAEASALSGANVKLQDGFIVSEAKFLLVDFCVNSFEAESQKYVDEIGKCKNERSLHVCVNNIYALTQTDCPDQMPFLLKAISEINQTA